MRWQISWTFGDLRTEGGELIGATCEAESECHALEWARENIPPSLIWPGREPVIKAYPYTTFAEDLMTAIERAKKQAN